MAGRWGYYPVTGQMLELTHMYSIVPLLMSFDYSVLDRLSLCEQGLCC